MKRFYNREKRGSRTYAHLLDLLLSINQHLLIGDLLSSEHDGLLHELLGLSLRVELHVDSSLESLVAHVAAHLNETDYALVQKQYRRTVSIRLQSLQQVIERASDGESSEVDGTKRNGVLRVLEIDVALHLGKILVELSINNAP